MLLNRIVDKKLVILIIIIFIFAFMFFVHPVSQIQENIVRTVVTENCSQQGRESLNEGILSFYNRNSWWDGLLCKDKTSNPINSKVSDIIPLNILYRELWPQKLKSKNIFFFEDNCLSKIPFFVQCALESAAIQNPSYTIFLITVTPYLEDESKTIQSLLELHPNIMIAQADYDSILEGTPIDSFRSPTRWTEDPDILKSHMSDAFKLALLWKEGGTYMDTDIISFQEIPSDDNIMVLDQDTFHGCFMKANRHHNLLFEIMKVANSTYDGSWNSMGSRPVAEGVAQHCNETISTAGKYKDITILPYNAFSPIAKNKIEEFFMTSPTSTLKKVIENAYGLHTNHFTMADRLNELGKNNLYDQICREYCPFSYLSKYGLKLN